MNVCHLASVGVAVFGFGAGALTSAKVLNRRTAKTCDNLILRNAILADACANAHAELRELLRNCDSALEPKPVPQRGAVWAREEQLLLHPGPKALTMSLDC